MVDTRQRQAHNDGAGQEAPDDTEEEPTMTHCKTCGTALRRQDIEAEYDECVACENAGLALKQAEAALKPCDKGCGRPAGLSSPTGTTCRACWDEMMDGLSMNYRQKHGLLPTVVNG